MVAAPLPIGSPRARLAAVAVLGIALSLLGGPAPASAQLVGSISGVVSAGGAPLANVWVEATPVTPTGSWAGRGFVTATDSGGRYRFPDVYHPHVKVRARAPALSGLASTYWSGAFTFATAEVLGVASSGTTADIELAAGGRVSGTVVGAGAPVAGARVTAYPADSDRSEPVGTARLAEGPGQFAIEGLPPVPVLLYAEPSPSGNLLGAWYDGAAFADAATPVDGGAETAGLRIVLPEGGEVSGTVRDDTGAPVSGARVSLTHCPGLCPLVATTDERGGYRIGSVPPGRGLMLYATADDQGLLPDWYRTPGGSAEERMDLAAGEVRDGRDLVLVRGAFLAAAIVDDATGAPVPGVSAELMSLTDPLLGFLPATRDRLVVRSGSGFLTADDPPGTGSTAAGSSDGPPAGSGQFMIGPVPPGEYRLAVYPGYRNPRYLPVVWGRPTGIDGTGIVRLAAGERVDVVVPLVAAAGAPPAPAAPAAPATGTSPEAAWPGLDAGFLAGAGAARTWLGITG
jgi:hypothetical protein